MPRPPLVRPRRAVLGGVCTALSRHLGIPLRRTRLITVIVTFCGGAGALFYLWLWAFVPLEEPARDVLDEFDDAEGAGDAETAASGAGRNTVVRRAPVAALLVFAAVVATIIAFFNLNEANEAVATQSLLAVIVASGAAVAWSLGFDRFDPSRSRRYSLIARGASVSLLVIAGAVTLSTRPNAANAVLGVSMVVFGVLVLVTPRILALWSDLMAERAARVRQEQRAEIAAHLHDSVLQTLALIQNRAGPSSEVARIARAQERELRDWLFAGDDPVAADLATELRGVAAAIELDYAVRIEVVAAGQAVDVASAALVAASREAMLNAARHAGGEVSVYVETPRGAVDVFIRDRGPGVNLDELPADRLGIRESIIGRMSRAGGSATVRPGGAGIGTEVHLHLEVPHD